MIKFICKKCGKEIERYHDESEDNHYCKSEIEATKPNGLERGVG